MTNCFCNLQGKQRKGKVRKLREEESEDRDYQEILRRRRAGEVDRDSFSEKFQDSVDQDGNLSVEGPRSAQEEEEEEEGERQEVRQNWPYSRSRPRSRDSPKAEREEEEYGSDEEEREMQDD